ncbi:phosphoesterase [Streptomyces phage VieEnRose]|nr:phosphoesterase [Streptomyces phage VieEnRose]
MLPVQPKGPTLRIVTWNAGNGTAADLRALLARCDVLAGQEWGDRADLSRAARLLDWTVLDGHGAEGQASTPLLVGPHVRVRREVAIPVLHSRYIGPGAGPDHNKPKHAIGGLLSLDGSTFGVVSTHLPATQGRSLRHEAAEDQVVELVRRFNRRRFPWFLCGDFNAVPTSGALSPLYRSGWTNSHRASRPLATHGQRPIDYVWWDKGHGVRFVRHAVEWTRSDHRALVAQFKLT